MTPTTLNFGNSDAPPRNGDRFHARVVISVGYPNGDFRRFEVEDHLGRVIARGQIPYAMLAEIETAGAAPGRRRGKR